MIKLLENLSKQKTINKIFNRKYRLEKQGFIEQSQELFKQQQKTNENIQKVIEQKPEQNFTNIKETVKRNKSIFNGVMQDNKFRYYSLPNSTGFQIKVDKNTGDIILLTSDKDIPLKNTIGLSHLLFNKTDKLNMDDILPEDLETYFEIYKILNSTPGTSKRIRNVAEHFNKLNELKAFNDTRQIIKSGKGIRNEVSRAPLLITISENPEELFKRLEILLAVKSEGHNNSKDEISAILDQLLKQKEITKDQYLEFLEA